MADNLSSEYYRAEIAMLNSEIKGLTERLESTNRLAVRDKYDPFGNPTDYKGFSGDYSRIDPRITEPGYKSPLSPDYEERDNLKKWYGLGGGCLLLRFVMTEVFIFILMWVIYTLIRHRSPDMSPNDVRSYMAGTSIMAGINTIVFIIANIITAVFGLKKAGIRFTSLIRTNDIGASSTMQYCLIGSALWYICTYFIKAMELFFNSLGLTTTPSTSASAYFSGGVPLAIFAIYTCLLAPITEELFFRGMLLRVFSRANQRFAVFASAFFFGMVHGNLQQFILAFVMGIFLGHITLKHGSIIPASGVHIFVNSLSLMTVFMKHYLRDVSFAVDMVLIVFTAIGVLLLIIFRITDRIPLTTPEQNRRGMSTATGSWGFDFALVILFANMAYVLCSGNL
ncbi:MAG: CPBP family intramembrane metalloprotease [Ruminococcus sp.]|nr:CPBP family intramembrane metalloprotease [Ruminococcus sp.]